MLMYKHHFTVFSNLTPINFRFPIPVLVLHIPDITFECISNNKFKDSIHLCLTDITEQSIFNGSVILDRILILILKCGYFEYLEYSLTDFTAN